LGEALLAPTRIYVAGCLAAHAAGGLKALAHITGGGLTGNIPRVLPPGLGCEIEAGRWQLPPVFRWLAEAGGITPAELVRTFNCGIGMVAISAPDRAAELAREFEGRGEQVVEVGRIVPHAGDGPRVHITGIETAWRS
jgi:phosphoribosylformylglycinamidine cyclo-ligase